MNPDNLTFDNMTSAVAQISQCSDEFAVHAVLRKTLPLLGADSYFYVTLLNHDPLEDCRKHRFFVGCAPQFSQLYNARKWFTIDPYIGYGRINSQVVCGDGIPLRSGGQKEMRQAAADFGFKSFVVVPSHCGTGDRFGILYLGSERAPEDGNPIMMANRILLRSIAMELLEWWALKVRTEMMQKLKLTEKEMSLLQSLREGSRASDVADELSISLKAVQNRVRLVKEKFDVDKIASALRIAAAYGLIN